MASNRKLLILTNIYVLKQKLKKKNKKRKCWIQTILKSRQEQGFHHNLIREIRITNDDNFFRFFRMTQTIFDELLTLIGPLIVKLDTHYRKCISARERLEVTLRYLASGDCQISLAYGFRLGRSTVCKIIKETCNAIWQALNMQYLKFPNSTEWLHIANDFHSRWNFPHCIGAIDGKHVQIICPPNSGSLYYNYKGTFSKVLLAISDAFYKFVYVDIGGYGGRSDGGIFSQSNFKKLMEAGNLDLPQQSIININGSPNLLPFFLVGDEAFPLKTYLLRPYPGRNLNFDQQIYNYRLSRARRVVENAFGILTARWRILRRPIQAAPETVDEIIKACVCLHNFVMTTEETSVGSIKKYCPPLFVDSEHSDGSIQYGEWRSDTDSDLGLLSNHGSRQNNYSSSAAEVRTKLTNYLCKDDVLPWQTSYINRCS